MSIKALRPPIALSSVQDSVGQTVFNSSSSSAITSNCIKGPFDSLSPKSDPLQGIRHLPQYVLERVITAIAGSGRHRVGASMEDCFRFLSGCQGLLDNTLGHSDVEAMFIEAVGSTQSLLTVQALGNACRMGKLINPRTAQWRLFVKVVCSVAGINLPPSIALINPMQKSRVNASNASAPGKHSRPRSAQSRRPSTPMRISYKMASEHTLTHQRQQDSSSRPARPASPWSVNPHMNKSSRPSSSSAGVFSGISGPTPVVHINDLIMSPPKRKQVSSTKSSKARPFSAPATGTAWSGKGKIQGAQGSAVSLQPRPMSAMPSSSSASIDAVSSYQRMIAAPRPLSASSGLARRGNAAGSMHSRSTLSSGPVSGSRPSSAHPSRPSSALSGPVGCENSGSSRPSSSLSVGHSRKRGVSASRRGTSGADEFDGLPSDFEDDFEIGEDDSEDFGDDGNFNAWDATDPEPDEFLPSSKGNHFDGTSGHSNIPVSMMPQSILDKESGPLISFETQKKYNAWASSLTSTSQSSRKGARSRGV